MEVIFYGAILLICFASGWVDGKKKMKQSCINFSKTNDPIKYFLGIK